MAISPSVPPHPGPPIKKSTCLLICSCWTGATPNHLERSSIDEQACGLLGALVLSLCGCDPVRLELSSCGTAHPGDSCPKEETCPGQCVDIPPYGGWELAALLWIGPEHEAPECPADRAPDVGYRGYAAPDPSDPPQCPTCTCEPPTGECGLPSVLTVSTDTCINDTPQSNHTDFSGLDADPTSCNVENVVLGNQGQQSVTIQPLTVIETGCNSPVPPPTPKDGTPSWKTVARACRAIPSPCLDLSKVCVPAAPPPPPELLPCIFQKGDNTCPDEYPTKHVFYDEVSDARGCSECSCAQPEGGFCSATVTIFQDADCSMGAMPQFVTSIEPQCVTIAAGVDLGGKAATVPSYQPGTCEPLGGESIGSVELKGPGTFCCL